MNRSRGFGLIEIMISLVLGLLIIAGILNIFISAKNTFVTQNASATMQEDARFILTKMVQEIRMVGMFGCLQTVADASNASDFRPAQITPITWNSSTNTLTLVTADVGASGGVPSWTVLSDCKSSATAYTGVKAAASGQMAFPVRQLIYQYSNNQISLGGAAIVSNVSRFSVLFGTVSATSTGTAADNAIASYTANPTNPATIRSVKLLIELSDPTGKVKNQTFSVVAALRNRLY